MLFYVYHQEKFRCGSVQKRTANNYGKIILLRSDCRILLELLSNRKRPFYRAIGNGYLVNVYIAWKGDFYV
ncbi:hypothetical protein ACQYAD_15310 [Neobacillus sp. SM06]|uniref:hypothetical protein n=1 Tax=Neobacillus sp. SM06 TaxID=3422492 RepID=UPI003D285994